jgi:tetratricopeptide (TPR) repeat protein
MPHFPLAQSNAAEGILAMGAWESAAEVANKAIAMEASTAPMPGAWWTRGEAEFQLGRVEDAQISFEASIARSALGPHTERSHRRLAEIAENRGDEAEAEIHRDLAAHVARNFAG